MKCGIQEIITAKVVPSVVPAAVTSGLSRKVLGLLFPVSVWVLSHWGCFQGDPAGKCLLKAHQDCSSLPVRPKLNVKPSVMKPAVQLKPAQKRRGAERSAVAAVKPLNSCTVPEQAKVCSPTAPHSSHWLYWLMMGCEVSSHFLNSSQTFFKQFN